MDDAWNELSFDFEPAVQAALPASGVGNTRDRFRTQVCRHWLRGLCMMGDRCDFLHKMDRNRMPICRWRTDCQVEGCAFRHEEEQEAPECAMYQHGFCRHGPHCRFRHVKRAREECPEIADFSLSNPTTFPTNNGGGGGGGPGSTRAASVGFSKSFGGAVYGSLVKAGTGIGARSGGASGGGGGGAAMEDVRKPSMCNHWRNGTECPYGDRCMYAHGEDDPRKFSSRPPLPPSRFGFGGKDPFTDPEVEAAVPVKEGAPARFFVLRSLNHDNLAVSTTQHKWYARRHSILPFNLAFEKPGKVMFLFSVNYSNNFQGCAQMMARIPEMEVRTQEVTVMEFSVKWLRMCELPFGTANQIKNTLNEDLPVGRSRDGMELNYDSGRKLCKLMWAQPEVELPKQVVDHAKTAPFSGVEVYRIPPLQPSQPTGTAPKAPRVSVSGAGDEGSVGFAIGRGRNSLQLLGPSPLPPPPRALGGPPEGFLFEIESQDFDECVGKLLFGLPRHLPPAAEKVVQPGNLMFLWDPGNALVLGIFRAVSGLTDMIDRTAWARRPGMETHLPWQVRVSVDLRAPPIKAGDPILREVFRSGRVEPGALDPRQVDILASTMAGRMQPPPPAAAAEPGFNGPGIGIGGGPGMRGMGGNISRPIQQY